jgi:peroxiredoxin
MRVSASVIALYFGVAALAGIAGQVPRPAPDFTISLPDGRKVPLSQYRGKAVALAFVSTTCPHCQHLAGVLNPIQAEYGPKGVQVLMCAFDDNAATGVPGFISAYRPVYPMGWADRTLVLGLMDISIMTPGYVPKLVFIDAKGMIREQHEGQEPYFQDEVKNIRGSLDELLKAEPAKARTAHKK